MRGGGKKEASQHVFPAFYHYAKFLDVLVSGGIHHRPAGSALNG